MPFQPYKLDDSFTRTEPGRPRVPQGYYKSSIEAVRPTPENYEKTPGFFIDFRITEAPDSAPGAGVGRTISRYFAMGGKEGSQFSMAGAMGAAGLGEVAKALRGDKRANDIKTWQAHAGLAKFINDRMVGRAVVLTIVDEVSPQGRPFSSVLEVQSADNWTALRGAAVGGPVTDAGSPRNGPTANASLAEQVQGMFETSDV